MAQLHFDATKVEPDNGIEVVPAGWYNAAIDESSNKPTRDGVNSYTQFRFSILDGQYKGRKLFARFNLQHTNAQTSEIAQRQLAALCVAAGVMQLSDTQQLHNIPMKVKAIIKKDEGYEATNEIRSYKNINESVDVQPAVVGQQAAPPVQPAQPWAQQTQAVVPAIPPVAPPVAQPPVAPALPEGWTPHPSAPGYYYSGNEVLSEADLRAKFAAPPAPPVPPAAPPAAPVAPPAQGGWQQPAGQQPWGQPGAVAPAASGAAPAAPAAPHPAQDFAPPWTRPAG